MIQINYTDLASNEQYLTHAQIEFGRGFDRIQDKDLRIALIAYVFWMTLPTPQISINKDNIQLLQLLNQQQYITAVLAKKMQPFPSVFELANALSAVIGRLVQLNGNTYSIDTIHAVFLELPQDIQDKYPPVTTDLY